MNHSAPGCPDCEAPLSVELLDHRESPICPFCDTDLSTSAVVSPDRRLGLGDDSFGDQGTEFDRPLPAGFEQLVRKSEQGQLVLLIPRSWPVPKSSLLGDFVMLVLVLLFMALAVLCVIGSPKPPRWATWFNLPWVLPLNYLIAREFYRQAYRRHYQRCLLLVDREQITLQRDYHGFRSRKELPVGTETRLVESVVPPSGTHLYSEVHFQTDRQRLKLPFYLSPEQTAWLMDQLDVLWNRPRKSDSPGQS